MSAVVSLYDEVAKLEYRHSQGRSDAVYALKEIHDSKEFWKKGGPLHEQYGSWERYLKERWDYSKTYGHYLLGFADMRQKAKESGLLEPENENQTRHLIAAKRNAERVGRKFDEMACWERIVDAAPLKDSVPQVTGKHVASYLEHEGYTQPRKESGTPRQVTLTKRAILELFTIVNEHAVEEFREKYGDALDREKLAVIHGWAADYLELG